MLQISKGEDGILVCYDSDCIIFKTDGTIAVTKGSLVIASYKPDNFREELEVAMLRPKNEDLRFFFYNLYNKHTIEARIMEAELTRYFMMLVGKVILIASNTNL